MGSKNSKNESEQKPEINQNINSNSNKIQLKTQIYQSNNHYDYNNEESSSTSQATPIEKNIKDKNENNKEINEINDDTKLYPFKFEWKGNGKSVLLAGNFLDNWNNVKVMIKNEKDIFERVVYLPKKKHEFKFIVDGIWTCSNQYPTLNDERGILNNFIDLRNYRPSENLIKEEEIKKMKLKELKQIENDKKSINKYYRTGKYDIKSLYDEFNSKPPKIIEHYKPDFNIDYQSNQKNIGICKKYLKYKQKNNLTENNTYKKILVCPHEKLMHFCPDISNIFNEEKDFIKISTTIRNQHKFLTTVYYKPKQLL